MRSPDLLTLIYVLIIVAQCTAFKILVAFPFPARSHNVMGRGVVRHLLKAGHEVTYITPFVTNNTKNFREIDVTDNFNAFNVSLVNIQSLMEKKTDFDPDTIFTMMMEITKRTMKSENIQKLLNDKTENFDVVISQWIFNEVFSGFATVFDCPHVWFFLNEPGFAALSLIDEAPNPSYIANVELNFVPPFTFWQRIKSLYFQANCMLRYYLAYRSIEAEVFEEAFGPVLVRRNRNLPPYEQVRINTSLILGNHHVSLGQAIRLPQNYISVGGQHIDEEIKPLPKDIKKLMDEAKHGVIFFSMGSNLKSKELPSIIKETLLKMFATLKQKVIWKFEDEIQDLPRNVHIIPWAPQQSILSHPNCVLFITHGGLLSTLEAVHFAIPFIGIPVYYDQLLNVEKSVINGVATKVKLTNDVAKHLEAAIHEMLKNTKYRKRMKELSFVYHHRPMSPGKELVHWVEHVVRTTGAMHLRSPALLIPWYQKMYIDLAFVVLIILMMILFCVRLCLKILVNKEKLKHS